MGKKLKSLMEAEEQRDENGNPTRLSTKRARRNPERAQKELIQMQEADFDKRFKPLEADLRAQITASPEYQARQADTQVTKQIALTRGQFNRDLGRSGTRLTDRQAGAISRNQGLASAKATASAKNISRRGTRDTNLEAQAAMIGIGRDVQSTANKDIAAAAGLASGRASAQNSADAAQEGSRNQMLGAAVGLAAAFAL